MHLPLLLDRSRCEGLTLQIVEQLRAAIRSGRLTEGQKLPSSRRLADQLGVSRNTVVKAIDVLESEGYVEARTASGIFVSGDWKTTVSMPTVRQPSPGQSGNPALQPRRGLEIGGRASLPFDFFPGGANQALFPVKAWRRIARDCLARAAPQGLVQRADTGGTFSLRKGVAEYLAITRGIDADPSQIMITSGVQEGLNVACRVLLEPGGRAAIEDPCRASSQAIVAVASTRIIRLPVDADGAATTGIMPIDTNVILVTPDHHFPTGATMPMERRLELVDWARRSGAFILEDCRGGDFRYDVVGAPSFASLAPDIAISSGDFAEVLGDGVRIGYLVVPTHLIEQMRAAKDLLTSGVGWLDQSILAEFINSGRMITHVMRAKLVLRDNRDALLSSLRRHFGSVAISGEESGTFLSWQLPSGVPDASTFETLARRARIGIYSETSAGAFHSGAETLSRRTVTMGYASLDPKAIERGIARLSQIVDDTLDARPSFVSELLFNAPISDPRPTKLDSRIRQKPALHAVPATTARLAADDRPGENGMGMVSSIYRYPIKGLSGQRVNGVALEEGRPFPFDRIFALARPGVPVDEEQPSWAKKGLFIMLMLEEQLAQVRTHLDAETLQLDVFRGDERVLSANLGSADGRRDTEEFIQRIVPSLSSPPKLVRSASGHFMDKPDNVLSLINLATVRDLEKRWGNALDPLRFRANFYVDGLAPWSEFDWIGSDIRIGDATFRVDRRNGRCSATNVNPSSGLRDLDIPGSLRSAFGHKDFGVYLVTRKAGKVVMGDPVQVPFASGHQEASASVSHQPAGQFICRGCYYIFDENATTPPVSFESLPYAWTCPDCGTGRQTFRPLMAQAS